MLLSQPPIFKPPVSELSYENEKGRCDDPGIVKIVDRKNLLSRGTSNGSKLRVAYQGIPGAYSEVAALKAYPKCETIPLDQFEDAFKAVELCLVDKAIIIIENSQSGSIHPNYDLLLHHKLYIVGETHLINGNQCLQGLPVSKKDIKCIFRQTQDDQCDDTTRFLILARTPIIPTSDGHYKTSIVFTLEEGPTGLFKALSLFALRGISLSKIESRPHDKCKVEVANGSKIIGNNKYFDYLFFIDFEASMAEYRAQYALKHLQEIARFLRVLGCYPMDTTL